MISGRDFAQAREVVRAAGLRALTGGKDVRGIVNKGVADYATDVDRGVQAELIKRLAEIAPQYPVIGEEGFSVHLGGAIRWIVDPVDGTTNMLHGYPHFSVSVALADSATIFLALVYHPHRDEMFSARRGDGAWLNNRRIHVSETNRLSESLIGFGLPYDRARGHEMFDAAQRVFTNTQDLRRSGSASLDLAYVSCGRLDGYFEFDLQPWDVAAGQLILSEAGGRVTTINGKELDASSRNDVVASNGRLHADLRSIVAGEYRR